MARPPRSPLRRWRREDPPAAALAPAPGGRRRRRARPPGGGRVLVALGIALVVVPVVAVLVFVARVQAIAADAPTLDDVDRRTAGRTSKIYDADGRLLGFVRSDVVRDPMPSRRMPQVLEQATIAIEDERFYEHRGVDFLGIVRAAAANLRSGEVVQGGSTLTMQLVRRLYISPERTLARKIKEAKLASEIERRRSKRWILTTYLNSVSFGSRGGRELVGAHAAARGFFDRPVWQLRLREAALLAGLAQSPTRLSPVRNPLAAKARRDRVLDAMARAGFIGDETARRVKRQELGLAERFFYGRRREPYVLAAVERRLREVYGERRTELGGLEVFTTVEPRLQRIARKAMRRHLGDRRDPEAAVVSIEPRTGRVRALANSTRYPKTRFGFATQARRQPGSAFKPMALVAALERGWDPFRTRYLSRPVDLDTDRYGKVEVKNFARSYGGGPRTIATGLVKSDNAVFTRLTLDLGPEAVRTAAHKLGIPAAARLKPYPSIVLGGLGRGVTPLEMARAYATLAGGGTKVRPVLIDRVELPDGRTAHPDRPHPTQAVALKTSRLASRLLERNVERGTGTAAKLRCPAAGKTGTTDSNKDAWFVGYTRRLTTAVWVGYPKPRPMTNVHGIRVTGGSFPARIWGDYMQGATAGRQCRSFPGYRHLDGALVPHRSRWTASASRPADPPASAPAPADPPAPAAG